MEQQQSSFRHEIDVGWKFDPYKEDKVEHRLVALGGLHNECVRGGGAAARVMKMRGRGKESRRERERE